MEWWKEGPAGQAKPLSQPQGAKPSNGHRFGEAPAFQDLSPNCLPARPVMNPVAPVPELKADKEKEKRGGAAVWRYGAPAARSVMIGARTSGSMGVWGFFNGARLASCLADFFGASSWVGGMFASGYGANLALAGTLGMAFLVGAAGVGMYARWSQGNEVAKVPALAPVQSTVAIKRPVDQSLGYVARANRGQVGFDAGLPTSTQPPESAHKKAKARKEDVPPPPPADTAKNGLDREQFVKKMTTNLQGGHPNGFQDALSGFANSNFKKFETGFANFSTGMSSFAKLGQNSGKLSSFSKKTAAFGSKQLTALAGKTNNALGQARLAAYMSGRGASSQPANAAKTYAADAFDQRTSQGGQMGAPGGSDTGNGIVNPLGPGAPDSIGGAGITNPPSVGQGTNVTPYQPQIDAAQGLGSSAGMLKLLSVLLLAVGATLIAIGIALKMNPFTSAIGAVIFAAGIALLAAGAMMLKNSMNMANIGSMLGNQISSQYGQQGQGQTINDCEAQAAANGTNPQNCKPKTNPIPTKDPVPPAINKEVSGSRYSIGQ